MTDQGIITPTDTGVRIRVKAVPGARRDEIASVLGDRLKIRVSAPPEGGRANAAIASLLASALGVPARNVSLVSNPRNPGKVFEALGVTEAHATDALGLG